MKKALILCGALMVFSAPAYAGLDATWNTCAANGGASDITMPCGTGVAALWAQFSNASTISGFTNLDFLINLEVDDPGLPGFYDFQDPTLNPGGCNPAYQFQANQACTGTSNALWGPPFAPGSEVTTVLGYSPAFDGPNRGRWKGSVFRASTNPTTLNGGTQYYGFNLNIFANFIPPACTGCGTASQWVWNEASLGSVSGVTGVEAEPVIITDPGTVSNIVTTDGGGNIPPDATSTESKSWGALKSLYR